MNCQANTKTQTRWVYRHKETRVAASTTNEAEAHRLADGMGVATVSKTAEGWAAIDGKGAGAQFFYEDTLAGRESGKEVTAGCEIWLAAKKLAICDPELAEAMLEGFRRALANDQANGIGMKPGLMAFAAMLEWWIGMAPAYIAELNQSPPTAPKPPQKRYKGGSPFSRYSVAWPLRNNEFAHIDPTDRKKLVRLLARVSEQSYRRGYHQGRQLAESGVDGYTFRDAKNLDWAPFAHAITKDGKWARHSGHPATERISIEYRDLRDLALPVD